MNMHTNITSNSAAQNLGRHKPNRRTEAHPLRHTGTGKDPRNQVVPLLGPRTQKGGGVSPAYPLLQIRTPTKAAQESTRAA